ncbi:hypothetical protein GW750_04545 [bacterium]|nr:hypothetical protein [bacterium]
MIVTDFSAPSELFATLGCEEGRAVYQLMTTHHPNASAVRIIFPTLYALRMFSSMTKCITFDV